MMVSVTDQHAWQNGKVTARYVYPGERQALVTSEDGITEKQAAITKQLSFYDRLYIGIISLLKLLSPLETWHEAIQTLQDSPPDTSKQAYNRDIAVFCLVPYSTTGQGDPLFTPIELMAKHKRVKEILNDEVGMQIEDGMSYEIKSALKNLKEG